MDDKFQDRKVNRRRLLRRAGTVAAGVAGAGVAGAVVATPASAAGANTFASNSPTIPTVEVSNAATSTEGLLTTIGPQLRLVPGAGSMIGAGAPAGSIAMDADGAIWAVTPRGPTGATRDIVYTSQVGSMTFPVTPTRIFDSDLVAMPSGRDRVLNPVGAFTTNKVKGGASIFIDLTDFVQFGYGIICNVVAVKAAAPGYITVGPYVSKTAAVPPSWSNLNYEKAVVVGNLVFTGIGGETDLSTGISTDAIAVYVHNDVRVVIDIFGFVVDVPGRITEYRMGSAGLHAAEPSFMARRRAQVTQYAPEIGLT